MNAATRTFGITRYWLTGLAWLGLMSLTASSARADLLDYLKRPEPAYGWKVLGEREVPNEGTYTDLKVTSQTWRGGDWVHAVRICTPKDLKFPNMALLFITGGKTGGTPGDDETKLGMTLAKLSGARVAILCHVPNQPLMGDRVEDDLISETFVNFLKTKEPDWPCLFPMVKSAVKTMDAVQEWAKTKADTEIKTFMVTGASKRGWTTWLTAANDPRVTALAPMVIDTLNMRVQIPRQKDIWGQFSEQIDDYSRRNLIETMETEEGMVLWKMVDPYHYRDKIKQPKLIINGANDRYWTVDALNIYWNDLVGPKSVVYLPNAGHNLKENREYALQGIGALFRHTAQGKTLPKLNWKFEDAKDGGVRLDVTSNPPAKSAQVWVVRSPNRDYREQRWEPRPMQSSDIGFSIVIPKPESGNIAIFGDMTYESDGIPFHLSTTVREVLTAPVKK